MANVIMYLLYLRAIIILPFLFLLKIISPNKKTTWIFSSWKGLKISDNSKYFYLYLCDKEPEVNLIWIVKDRSLVINTSTLYYLSLKGLYYQLTAEACFFTHSILSDFLGLYIKLSTAKKVQLWHGSPYKKIMYDAKGNWLSDLKKKIFDKSDLYICANDFFKDYMVSAFRDESSKFISSGLPRVCVPDSIESSKKKCFIYMPTFRDGYEFSPLFKFESYGWDVNFINDSLKRLDSKLIIRLHPNEKLSQCVIDEIESASNIILDESDDIYENVFKYDALITDYSSIVFDFMAVRKPIIFAPFDLEEYQEQTRGVYFSYSDISVKPYAKNWSEVIDLLKRLSDYPLNDLEQKAEKFSQDKNINSSEYIHNQVVRRFF